MLFFLVLLLIIILFIYVLFYKKQYLRPDHLLSLYWVINISAGLLMFNVSNDWNYYPLIYILLCCGLFSYGFTIGNKMVIKKKNKNNMTATTSYSYIKTILIIGIIAGFIYAIDLLLINGFSLRTAISNIRIVGNYFNNVRYLGDGEKTSFIGQTCLTIYYSLFVFGGLFHKRIPKARKFILIGLVPGIFNMLCTTSKTVVISPILLWASGVLVEKRLLKEDRLISEKGLDRIRDSFKYIAITSIIFVVIFESFVIRYGGTTYTNIYQRIAVYALGHIPCFDAIFVRCNFSFIGEGFGFYSFRWLFELLGLTPPVDAGKYDFSYTTNYGFTNVPTIFVDFIMDYGYIGSIVEIILFGLLVGILFRNVNHNSYIIISSLCLAYYCILYSFLVNPMRYLSIVGAFFMISIYLLIGNYINNEPRSLLITGRNV